MNNYFLSEMFGWNHRESKRVCLINKLLRTLGLSAKLVSPYSTGYMTNIEVRMNLFHLLSSVLAYHVPGDLIELGCHTGETAAMFQVVNHQSSHPRRLHVFDSFQSLEGVPEGEGRFQFEQNFSRYNLPLPEIHQGWFESTVPRELPPKIAFAHIDVGPGQSPEALRETVASTLGAVFERLSPGGVIVFADYVDRALRPDWTVNLPVSEAVDNFFVDRSERPQLLYAGAYCHGFVRKALE